MFEGKDEFGRLQPLLGTAEPATDYAGNPINWPATPEYSSVGLMGQMEGSIAWHSPTTENPALNSTEEWEIWNMTGDAHPVHLHLVHFEILGRQTITWDSNTIVEGDILADGSTATEDDETRVIPNAKAAEPAERRHIPGYTANGTAQFRCRISGDLWRGIQNRDSYSRCCCGKTGGVCRKRAQGYGHGFTGTGDAHQGHVRQTGPLRLALPHPLA